jgi:hypothetical protein
MAQSIQLTLLNGATTTGDGPEDRTFDKSMDVLQSSSRPGVSTLLVACLHPAEPDARVLKTTFDFGPWQ